MTKTVCALCLGTGKVFHENPPQKNTPWSPCHCRPQDEDISPAVARARDHFWKKVNEYEKSGRIDEIRAFYNDMIQLQQSTDIVSINKVLNVLDTVLQLLDAD